MIYTQLTIVIKKQKSLETKKHQMFYLNIKECLIILMNQISILLHFI
ncbi:ORF277 [Staphylococcus phage Twort]|uniref:ORF277 n=1 Tax=Staphylococcus phage Twort (strain DSM 17442 / HER 48) TaxID=2908167 RepID=Q4Z9D5_BPTWO|nr:ORF277 [Staphylococcus phage Twort]AAX92478.1 ORF277 [Staphylococcus phage Twort]